MPKVFIDEEEMYPTYVLEVKKSLCTAEADISEAQFEEWKKVIIDFKRVQLEMKEIFKKVFDEED